MSDDQQERPAPEAPVHAIDREIYGMPSFVSLEVSDLADSSLWYQQALGFVELAVLPGPAGSAALIHLRRYRYQDVLLRPADAAPSPSPTVTVGLAFAGSIDELRRQAEVAGSLTSGHVEGPVETPWHTVDVRFRDPDGHQLVLTARSPAPPPEAWNDLVRHSVVTPDGPPS